MEDKVYWQTKDGKILDVDSMTDSHVRHVFKMILRKLNKAEVKLQEQMLSHNDTYPGSDYEDTWIDVSFFDH